jgi:hypothetical protein
MVFGEGGANTARKSTSGREVSHRFMIYKGSSLHRKNKKEPWLTNYCYQGSLHVRINLKEKK